MIIEGTVLQTLMRAQDRAMQCTLSVLLDDGTRKNARIMTSAPPMPGTRIKMDGLDKTFHSADNSYSAEIFEIDSERKLTLITGQQGVVFRTIVEDFLKGNGIAFDRTKLVPVFNDPTLHLAGVNYNIMRDVLKALGVADPAAIMAEYDEYLSDSLTLGSLQSMGSIRLPFKVDLRENSPFKMLTWPADVYLGCTMNKFMEVTAGREAHPNIPANRKLFISEIVPHDGVDMFYRSISVAFNQDSIFSAWLNCNWRQSTIAHAFVRDKEKEGIQIYTPEDLRRLKSMFGINAPDIVIARATNVYAIDIPGHTGAMIQHGTYQLSSVVAELRGLPRAPMPLTDFQGQVCVPDISGLDPEQSTAVTDFCKGYPLMLLSGPPGTGKSTVISRLRQTAALAGGHVVVLTPTGKAASRLGEDGVPAQTMHGLIYGAGAFSSKAASENKLSLYGVQPAINGEAFEMFPGRADRSLARGTVGTGADAVIRSPQTIFEEIAPPPILANQIVVIDEASQVTSSQLALIFSLGPRMVILVGDPGQLPPVGAGKPFHDLIDLARDGKLAGRVILADLKTDHRATQQLSAFTTRVRQGELPAEFTLSLKDFHDGIHLVKQISGDEAVIIETEESKDTMEVVSALIEEDMAVKKPFYSFRSMDAVNHLPKSLVSMILPYRVATQTLSTQTVVPDILLMASTNERVNEIAAAVKKITAPHKTGGQEFKHILPFAALASANIKPGDLVMQTENSKKYKIQYNVGGAVKESCRVMNGEAFVLAGANAWIPLPRKSATDCDSDFQLRLYNLWGKTGLHQQASLGLSAGQQEDPDFNLSLYRQLQNSSQNVEAQELLSMALIEMVLVDTAVIRKLAAVAPRGSAVPLPIESVRTIIVPPRVSKKSSVDACTYWSLKVLGERQIGAEKTVESMTKIYRECLKTVETFVAGEASTVHKAQGSQAAISLCIAEEPIRKRSNGQHEQGVYTGLTRAGQRGIIILQGTTVGAINDMWKVEREAKSLDISPIKLIVNGVIPSLAGQFQGASAHFPYQSTFVRGGISEPKEIERQYIQHALMSCQNLPGLLEDACAPHAANARQIGFSAPSESSALDRMGIAYAPTNGMLKYPGSLDIIVRSVDDGVLKAKSRHAAWRDLAAEPISATPNPEMEIDFDNLF